MANVDWDVLGKRIREARKRAALNQADLARATGLERTALNRIESGTRKVTALELADIADAIGVRMASFFEEPLPALVSHRSATGLDTPDSKIDSLLAEIADDVELVVSLSAPGTLVPDDSEAAPPDPEHWKVALSRPEDMAREVRELMGEDTLGPIQVLTDRVAELGLLVFSADIGQDTADAGTILLPSGAVSLVNSFMKAGRRRLALAHELGHYLIADDYSVDWRPARRTSSRACTSSHAACSSPKQQSGSAGSPKITTTGSETPHCGWPATTGSTCRPSRHDCKNWGWLTQLKPLKCERTARAKRTLSS